MKKVLLIEDDNFLTDDLKFFLESEGDQCEVYTMADQVVQNLNNLGQFDKIVLDIMMRKGTRIPEVAKDEETGEVLYRMIRKAYPKKDIIVISGKDYEKMKIDFRNEDNVDTLEKPVNNEFIKDLLRLIGK